MSEPISQFRAIADELCELHDRKSQDYGRKEDPLANVRASTDFGVPAWVGALIRGNDKVKRLQTYVRTGLLANEGVEDSLMDLAVYAMIALQLFREQQRDASCPVGGLAL